MEFTTVQYADVSTAFITEKDRELILSVDDNGKPNAPHVVAAHKDKFGSYFYTSTATDDPKRMAANWRAFGFSDRFIEIMTEAGRQNISYVCFDADGGHIEGLEPNEDVAETYEAIS